MLPEAIAQPTPDESAYVPADSGRTATRAALDNPRGER